MKHISTVLIALCLSFTTLCLRAGISVVKEHPVHRPLYLVEAVRQPDGRLFGSCKEVIEQFIDLGASYEAGGAHGNYEYRYNFQHMGCLRTDGEYVPSANADIYALTVVEQHPNKAITNYVAVVYLGEEKAIFASSRLYITIGPTKKRGSDYPDSVFAKLKDPIQNIAAVTGEDIRAIGGVKKNQARIDGDRLTIYMPEIPLALFIYNIIQNHVGIEIENQVDESILDILLKVEVEDMYWEDAVTSVLKEHGLMLVKDKNTGEYSIRRKK